MIDQLLIERAKKMAAHDGVPSAGAVHIHGAANQLQAELLRARDDLLNAPPPANPAPKVPAWKKKWQKAQAAGGEQTEAEAEAEALAADDAASDLEADAESAKAKAAPATPAKQKWKRPSPKAKGS